MSAWGSSAVSRFRKTLKPSTRLYLRRCQYFPLMFQILTIPRYLIPQSSSQAFYLPLLRKRHSYRREAFLKATKSFARLPQIPYAIARPRTVTRFLTRASATHSHMSGDVCNIYSMKANSGEEVPASNGSEDLHSPDDRTADQNGRQLHPLQHFYKSALSIGWSAQPADTSARQISSSSGSQCPNFQTYKACRFQPY